MEDVLTTLLTPLPRLPSPLVEKVERRRVLTEEYSTVTRRLPVIRLGSREWTCVIERIEEFTLLDGHGELTGYLGTRTPALEKPAND